MRAEQAVNRSPLRTVLSVALLGLTACSSDTPTTPVTGPDPQVAATQRYLSDMLNVMQLNSINRERIDWQSLRAQVQGAASGAQTVFQGLFAVRVALQALGDGHSSYTSAGGTFVFVGTRTCSAPTAATPPRIADIGYVRVRGFSGTQAQALAFADTIHRDIRSQDAGAPIGWIVDLRGNTGGNMWPMIAGVGPILGEGNSGAFVDPTGTTVRWGYSAGASVSEGRVITPVPNPYTLRQPAPRVAVLIDNLVASSGEATTIAFKARAGTRFFGAPTCGLSTANQLYTLSDGALLNLTVSTMADRTGRLYGEQVAPDEVLPADSVVIRATEWLRTGR